MSYKKNVADVRNSLALNVFNNLKKKIKYISAYDPLIDKNKAKKLNILTNLRDFIKFDVYVLITKHQIILKQIKKLKKDKIIINIFDDQRQTLTKF